MTTTLQRLFNLADALSEDILNTPDDELLREVAEDYGDPLALAKKFDDSCWRRQCLATHKRHQPLRQIEQI